MEREREAMLDLSPDNALGLTLAKNFNVDVFVETEKKYAVDIRETTIMRDLMAERFKFLFGEEI
jgi:hypothetical protein